LGDFKIGGQVILTVKCADDVLLLPKEEGVVQGMIDRLIEVGRYHEMKMNVEKTKVNEKLKATTPSADYERSKRTGECEIFRVYG